MPPVRSDDVETGIGQAIQHLHVMPDCHVNARETPVSLLQAVHCPSADIMPV